MSHESVVKSLKDLIRLELLKITPKEHGEHLANESDRTAIILTGAMVERFVLVSLQNLMQHTNAEESNRIFNYEGPCGSFSNRIRLAHALGVFDRQTKRSIELIKEMRNAAAHCIGTISFETPEIRNAVMLLIPEQYRDKIKSLSSNQLNLIFDRICARLNMIIISPDKAPTIESMIGQVLGDEWHLS